MENTFDYKENMDFALENIANLLPKNRNLMDSFKKKTYADSFQRYMTEMAPTFEAIERACVAKEKERAFILDSVINRFLQEVEKETESLSKSKKNIYLDTAKMSLALYGVPMVLELKKDISEEFSDRLIERWKETYPRHIFFKGTYGELVEGFQKKGFCYITTAVCERKNKPDDCYELMMFRRFRDGCLKQEEDEETLIQRYYETAPLILKAIDMHPERETIYEGIWEEHLSACLNNLETDNPALCKENYVKMIRDLKKRYLSE